MGGGDAGGGPCGWEERREGKERGRSGLCGHGWCVWGGGGRRKEEGREGEGGRGQLTAQNLNTHTGNPFFLAWFVIFTEQEKFCNVASRAGTILSSAISCVKASVTLEPFIGKLFSSVFGVGPRQEERHGFGGLENTPLGQRGTDPKR